MLDWPDLKLPPVNLTNAPSFSVINDLPISELMLFINRDFLFDKEVTNLAEVFSDIKYLPVKRTSSGAILIDSEHAKDWYLIDFDGVPGVRNFSPDRNHYLAVKPKREILEKLSVFSGAVEIEDNKPIERFLSGFKVINWMKNNGACLILASTLQEKDEHWLGFIHVNNLNNNKLEKKHRISPSM